MKTVPSPYDHLGPSVPLWGLFSGGRCRLYVRAPDHDQAALLLGSPAGEIRPDPEGLLKANLYTFVGGKLSGDLPVWQCAVHMPEGLCPSFFVCKAPSFFEARAIFRRAAATFQKSVESISERTITHVTAEHVASLEMRLEGAGAP